MRIRWYQPSDYKVIEGFYTDRGWEVAPKENILPRRGIVAEESDTIAAVGFLYQTDSPVWLLEWTATNPSLKLRARYKGLKMVLEEAKSFVKQTGSSSQIIQMMPNDRLVEFYKKQGFTKTETVHLVHFI